MNHRILSQFSVLAGANWIISACTAAQPNTSANFKPTPNPTTKAVQILSHPPGAKIEINDNYIGEAPMTVQSTRLVNPIWRVGAGWG
jgi:hypothetical protein